jgi:hypothetical protein
MEQLETLFDVGGTAWRVEIRLKGGGGPFDPAGFSVMILDPQGQLVANYVRPDAASEWPMAQLVELLQFATRYIEDALLPQTVAEVKRRQARTKYPPRKP